MCGFLSCFTFSFLPSLSLLNPTLNHDVAVDGVCAEMHGERLQQLEVVSARHCRFTGQRQCGGDAAAWSSFGRAHWLDGRMEIERVLY